MRYIAFVVFILALAACGSSPKAAAPPTSAGVSVAGGITCADIDTDLNTVVSDFKKEEANLRELSVSGGDSAGLQALISETKGARDSNKLDANATTFNSDASAYLSANSRHLTPGWEAGFDLVTSDINTLAKDCGQPTAPQNDPASEDGEG